MDINEEQFFICPYCGSKNSIAIDYSAGKRQGFAIDCEVCCRPIVITLEIKDEEIIYFNAGKENE